MIISIANALINLDKVAYIKEIQEDDPDCNWNIIDGTPVPDRPSTKSVCIIYFIDPNIPTLRFACSLKEILQEIQTQRSTI